MLLFFVIGFQECVSCTLNREQLESRGWWTRRDCEYFTHIHLVIVWNSWKLLLIRETLCSVVSDQDWHQSTPVEWRKRWRQSPQRRKPWRRRVLVSGISEELGFVSVTTQRPVWADLLCYINTLLTSDLCPAGLVILCISFYSFIQAYNWLFNLHALPQDVG